MGIRELQTNFAKELVNESADLTQDLLEIGLDSILENEILKEIPVIKTIAVVGKIGLSIKERAFAKKLIRFIYEFNNGTISEDDLIKFRSKMESSKSYRDETTEQLIIILDRLEETKKTSYICKLFIGYIENKISWDNFISFSQYVSFMTTKDFKLLEYLEDDIDYGKHLSTSEKKELEGNANKLMHFNFVRTKAVTGSFFGVAPVTVIYSLTEDGINFLSCFKW